MSFSMWGALHEEAKKTLLFTLWKHDSNIASIVACLAQAAKPAFVTSKLFPISPLSLCILTSLSFL